MFYYITRATGGGLRAIRGFSRATGGGLRAIGGFSRATGGDLAAGSGAPLVAATTGGASYRSFYRFSSRHSAA